MFCVIEHITETPATDAAKRHHIAPPAATAIRTKHPERLYSSPDILIVALPSLAAARYGVRRRVGRRTGRSSAVTAQSEIAFLRRRQK
jgi:hypothetical protein